jgi:hypothetical protein
MIRAGEVVVDGKAQVGESERESVLLRQPQVDPRGGVAGGDLQGLLALAGQIAQQRELADGNRSAHEVGLRASSSTGAAWRRGTF